MSGDGTGFPSYTNEYFFNAAQKMAKLGYWKLDVRRNRLIWSDEIYRIFGLEPQSVRADFGFFLRFVHPDDRSYVIESYRKHIEKRVPYDIVHRILLPGHGLKYLKERCETRFNRKGRPVFSIGTVLDITEQKKTEEMLRSSLNDRDVLIKELFHRTRNNMQLIIAMLNLFSGDRNNQVTGEFLRDTENRIQIIALAHEKLIESGNLSYINLKTYLEELSGFLLHEYRCSRNIDLEYNMIDYDVTIDTAVPCGLITNELFKCALGKSDSGGFGCIGLILRRCGRDELEFVFRGDGCCSGLRLDSLHESSRMTNCMNIFAESQLNARIEICGELAPEYHIIFKPDMYEARV